MISDIATEQGRDPLDVFLDLCISEQLDAQFLTVRVNGDEDAAGEILKHPATVAGLSDAGAHAALVCRPPSRNGGFFKTIASGFDRLTTIEL